MLYENTEAMQVILDKKFMQKNLEMQWLINMSFTNTVINVLSFMKQSSKGIH